MSRLITRTTKIYCFQQKKKTGVERSCWPHLAMGGLWGGLDRPPIGQIRPQGGQTWPAEVESGSATKNQPDLAGGRLDPACDSRM